MKRLKDWLMKTWPTIAATIQALRDALAGEGLVLAENASRRPRSPAQAFSRVRSAGKRSPPGDHATAATRSGGAVLPGSATSRNGAVEKSRGADLQSAL